MKPQFGRDLTTGSIPRHLVLFSVPMLIGSFLQTGYSFVNAIWVGQFLGTHALAAVTVSFPIVFFLYGIGMGLSLATSILVSQSFGAKRFDELRTVVDSSNLLLYGLGLVLTIAGEVFAPSILRAMGTPADIFAESVHYLRVFMLTLPFAFGYFLTRSLLQGTGDSKTPLYFQTASILMTTVLDPILMFGWLGAPKLGLNGTAWASVIAHALGYVGMIWYLHARKPQVAPAWPRFQHLGPMTWKTLRIGFPSAVQQSLISIGMVFVTGIVNSFGETATAAFGAASRIDQLIFMPAMTLGMAVSTLTGQNLGAGLFDRVKEVFRWGCLFTGGLTLLSSVLVVAIPGVVLRIFVNDPAVIELGVSYLHIVGGCYVFFALMFISNGVINGAGQTVITTVISLISLWVIRVPVAYVLSQRLGSVNGIWFAIALSFVGAMSVSMLYYFSGRWKRAVVKKKAPLETEPDPAEIFGHEAGEA